MKLKCTIGSLSCDGILAESGDVFELPEKAGQSVIDSGYAVEIVDPITEASLEPPTAKTKSRRGNR